MMPTTALRAAIPTTPHSASGRNCPSRERHVVVVRSGRGIHRHVAGLCELDLIVGKLPLDLRAVVDRRGFAAGSTTTPPRAAPRGTACRRASRPSDVPSRSRPQPTSRDGRRTRARAASTRPLFRRLRHRRRTRCTVPTRRRRRRGCLPVGSQGRCRRRGRS